MRFRRVDSRQQGGCGGITESLEPLSTLEAEKKLVAQREDGMGGAEGGEETQAMGKSSQCSLKLLEGVVVLGPRGRLGPIVRLTGPWALACRRWAEHVIT